MSTNSPTVISNGSVRKRVIVLAGNLKVGTPNLGTPNSHMIVPAKQANHVSV